MDSLAEAPCGYIAFRDDQRIRAVNAECIRVLERSRESLINTPIAEILPLRTRIFFNTHVYPALARNGAVHEFYVSLRKANGEEFATLCSATRRMVDDEMLCECVFLPMRRRQLFEQELIASKRAAQQAVRAEQHALEQVRSAQAQLATHDQLTSLGLLAAGVAHEINNPLAYVMGNLELLAEQMQRRQLGPELRELLDETRDGVFRIREIVSSLLTMSRTGPVEARRPVDVMQVVDVAARMARHEISKSARFELQRASHVSMIEGDAGRLGQVVLNLLINAAQALPEGRAENVVCLRVFADANHEIIEVEDNGPGIPPEIQARIFEPFFTTKPVGKGTGLGLSVCRGIIAGLGGSISVSSELGAGACFRITLPRAPRTSPDISESVPAPMSAAPQNPAVTAGMIKLLIVDDDEHVTRMLKRVLTHYQVSIINHSAEARRVLTAGADFDIILCDLTMPEVSGVELYTELEHKQPALARRMVFMTGGTSTAGAEAFLRNVKNPTLSKPFTSDALRAVCLRVLERTTNAAPSVQPST